METEVIKLLRNAGYESGWAVAGEVLILWEHEEDPPAPLTRPQTDEPVEGEQP